MNLRLNAKGTDAFTCFTGEKPLSGLFRYLVWDCLLMLAKLVSLLRFQFLRCCEKRDNTQLQRLAPNSPKRVSPDITRQRVSGNTKTSEPDIVLRLGRIFTVT